MIITFGFEPIDEAFIGFPSMSQRVLCRHCNQAIYYNEAVKKWRHYDVFADHDAEPKL
jgi:hypothetical protein